MGCRWSPSSFPQFFHILSTFAGRPRRFIWVLFAALCWSLWNVRNRHIFQAKVIRQPTDIIYPWIILLQQWMPAARPQDKAGLALLVERLRLVHAELTASDAARTQGVGWWGVGLHLHVLPLLVVWFYVWLSCQASACNEPLNCVRALLI
jgi:hypothetical protein